MRFLQLIFALTIAFSVQAQDRQIKFRTLTFDEAIAAAKAENKPIFIDCYTVWCGPCKWMSANIFTKNAVADFYNKNFVCVKFDMEKGEGPDIAKMFSVDAYPTLIFVNGNGELVMKTIGASQVAESYITLGENALSDEYNLVALAKNVANNRDDAEYMSNYFTIMTNADMVDDKEVEAYFEGMPEEQWRNETNFNILSNVVEDIEHPLFLDVVEHADEYRQANGDAVDGYISYVVSNALVMTLYSRSTTADADYQAILEQIEPWQFADKKAMLFNVEAMKEKRNGSEAYMAFCADKVEEFLWDDADQLNIVAWYFFENTTNADYLAKAEKWAERAVEMNPVHHVLDTYGNLLFATKKYEKALEIETEALEKAKAAGESTSSYQAVIDKIKAAM